jgi:hypothetical protein
MVHSVKRFDCKYLKWKSKSPHQSTIASALFTSVELLRSFLVRTKFQCLKRNNFARIDEYFLNWCFALIILFFS